MRFHTQTCIFLLAHLVIRRTSALALSSLPPQSSGLPSLPYQRNPIATLTTNATNLVPSFHQNIGHEVATIQARHPGAALYDVQAKSSSRFEPAILPLKRIQLHFILPQGLELEVTSDENVWGRWNLERMIDFHLEGPTMTWDRSFIDVTLASDILQASQFAGPWYCVLVTKPWPGDIPLRPGRVYYIFFIIDYGTIGHLREVGVDALSGEVISI